MTSSSRRPSLQRLAACLLIATTTLAASGCVDMLGARGSLRLKLTTDATGRVVRAEILDPTGTPLDDEIRKTALTKWKGPPNTTRVFPFQYRLDSPFERRMKERAARVGNAAVPS